MLGYAKKYRDRIYAEGYAEGLAEVRAEYYKKILEWNRRRIQAEKDGREFTEPIPISEDTLESAESQ